MPGTTANRGYPYPTPGDPTNVPGDIQKLAEAVNDDVQANLATVTGTVRAIGSARSSGNQAILTGVETSLTYGIQLQDTDNMVDVVGNPTVITTRQAGKYWVHALVSISTTATWDNFVFRIRQNNSTSVVVSDQEFMSTNQTSFDFTISSLFQFAAGDTINATVLHNSPSTAIILAAQLVAVRMAS